MSTHRSSSQSTYQLFARNDPEHRARRKLERAAARRRNDQNWGALWAAPAEPEPVAVPPPASLDNAAAPAPAPETAARDAKPAAALVTLLRARDEPAAAAALSHEKAAAPPSLHDDAEPTAAAPPPPLHDDAAPPPPPPQDSDDESAPLRLPATGQTGTQWSQWTTGPASQRAASQWATPPPPAWDDALRRRLGAAAPVDAVITPISGQTLPGFELVHGASAAIRLVQRLRPRWVVPMRNGANDASGLAAPLVTEIGNAADFARLLQERRKEPTQDVELLSVRAGEPVKLDLGSRGGEE